MKTQSYGRLRVQTRNRHRSERGQTLVVVALVFVGLVAAAGLAVDGGNLFVQRRQAQIAADAAALAGTRLIAEAMQTCDSLDLFDYDLLIARMINDYAEQNGIHPVSPQFRGNQATYGARANNNDSVFLF